MSYDIYCDFVNAVRLSFKLSELKEVVKKQKNFKNIYPDASILDEFVKLALLDKGKNNNSLLKACLMNLWTFIEGYIRERYTIIPTEQGGFRQLNSRNDNINWGMVSNRIFVKKQKITNTSYYKILEAWHNTENQVNILQGFEEVDN